MKKILKFTLAAALILVLFFSAYAASSKQPFQDVPVGAWYEKAVAWAYECGITNGVDDTHFEPYRPITRAEMVTMLWRLSGGAPEETGTPETPKPTPKPRTLADLTYQVPEPHPTIVPEYRLDYYGRMYIGDTYSVGLYDTLDRELVDASDAAFIMRQSGGCRMIGDHDSEGLWIIRWCGEGDTMKIVRKDGTVELYEWQMTDSHVQNKGSDVWDDDGNSCFRMGYDLFIATCNDSEGVYMTATFWRRIE